MHADVACARDALHDHLEAVDGFLGDEVFDRGSVGIALVDGISQIATETARVVSERAGGVGVLRSAAGYVELDGAEVDGHVDEGTGGDTAAAGAGWEVDWRETAALAAAQDYVGLVGDVDAVAGHGGRAAVEDGRGGETGLGGLGPVPVGLGAAVSAFFAEGLLVQRGEVAMQAEEIAGVVGGLGLVDVGDDEVIEARFGSWG